MNLAELYSLQLGQPLDKPSILDKFYPLPFEKYICFGPFSKPSKNYDYYDETLSLIRPYLQKENIHIVQIGGGGESGFDGCFHTQGKTTFNQLSFLIKNSLLVFGADSVWQHIAGTHNIPLVDLISNNYADCVRPYFGDKEKQIIIEPNRQEGERPSFALDEGPKKQINRIKPETIAVSILDLLQIKHQIKQKTLKIGEFYNKFILECVPNQVIDYSKFSGAEFYIRADLNYDLNNIFNQLSVGPSSIITNKPLPISELEKLKKNIQQIIYLIWPGYSKKFIEDCIEAGIKINIASFKDENWIKEQKIDLFEYGIIHPILTRKKESFEELKNIDPDKIYYKSRKFVLSNGKIYQGKAAYIKNQSINSFVPTIQKIIDIDDFYYDADHFYFLTLE